MRENFFNACAILVDFVYLIMHIVSQLCIKFNKVKKGFEKNDIQYTGQRKPSITLRLLVNQTI